ncbi:MAG: hypothetical protein JO112_09660, partial [Planctomycetes bacterium]|nr:hypothetical protein [Planctomycetota bacterium]
TFALMYLPFFAAYGAAEYAGYLAGTQAFAQRMRPVYGLFLFGGAAAFALAAGLQQPLGVPRLLVAAVFLVGVARLLMSRRFRWYAGLELAVLAGLACWPGFDGVFMNGFKLGPNTQMSTASHRKKDQGETAYAGWGKYAYLEILHLQMGGRPSYMGFYNDCNMWQFFPLIFGEGSPADYWRSFRVPPRDRVPFWLLPKQHGSVALIGSGGGREVLECRLAGAERILALELEPGVVQAIQGPLAEDFDRVYSEPPVEVRTGDARGYLERHPEKFDLIMLMSVGSYPQLMLEPGNMIRTIEAFRLLVDHVAPGGSLVIGYDSYLDKEGVLLSQYNQTLRQLGLETYACNQGGGRGGSYLLIAFRSDGTPEQNARRDRARVELAKGAEFVPGEALEVADFHPITDDRPYLAGNIRNVLSEDDLRIMGGKLGGVVVLVGLVLVVLLRHGLARHEGPVRQTVILGLGVLVGANFMLLEYLCVIHLFRYLFIYYDALILAMVAFLTVSGLGSFLVPARALVGTVAAALGFAALYWWGSADWGGLTAALLLVPLVLVTGLFFPVLFEQWPAGRLALFAMDAVGAAAGGLVAFFVPMLFGLRAYATVALTVFLLTGLAMLLFLWRRAPRVMGTKSGQELALTR